MTVLEAARLGRPPAWTNWVTGVSSVVAVWALGSLLLDAYDPSTDMFDRKAQLVLMGLTATGGLGTVIGLLLRAAFTPENEKAN
jgi:hypothetical protein